MHMHSITTFLLFACLFWTLDSTRADIYIDGGMWARFYSDHASRPLDVQSSAMKVRTKDESVHIGSIHHSVCLDFANHEVVWFGSGADGLPVENAGLFSKERIKYEREFGGRRFIHANSVFIDIPQCHLNMFHFAELATFTYSVSQRAKASNNFNPYGISLVVLGLEGKIDPIIHAWHIGLVKLMFPNVKEIKTLSEMDTEVCFPELLSVRTDGISSFFASADHIDDFRSMAYAKFGLDMEMSKEAPIRPHVLYIRRFDNKRLIRNEEEIIAWLASKSKFKFSVVSFDHTLPFAMQVASIASADVIISATGAALTNLIFARPNTTVVILAFPGVHEWDFLIDEAKASPGPRRMIDRKSMWHSAYSILALHLGLDAHLVSLPRTPQNLRETTSLSEEHIRKYGHWSLRQCEMGSVNGISEERERIECYIHQVLSADFSVDIDEVKKILEHYC